MTTLLDDSKAHKSWELVFENAQSAAKLVSDYASKLKRPIGKWDSSDGQRHVVFQFTKGIFLKDLRKWLHDDSRIQICRPVYTPRPGPATVERLKEELLKPLEDNHREFLYDGNVFQKRMLDGLSESYTLEKTTSLLNKSSQDVTQTQNSFYSNDSPATNSNSFLSNLSNDQEDKQFHSWIRELSQGKTLEQIEEAALESEKTTALFLLKKKALFEFFSDLNRRKFYQYIFWPQCQERIQKKETTLNELISLALSESDMYKFNFLLSKVLSL